MYQNGWNDYSCFLYKREFTEYGPFKFQDGDNYKLVYFYISGWHRLAGYQYQLFRHINTKEVYLPPNDYILNLYFRAWVTAQASCNEDGTLIVDEEGNANWDYWYLDMSRSELFKEPSPVVDISIANYDRNFLYFTSEFKLFDPGQIPDTAIPEGTTVDMFQNAAMPINKILVRSSSTSAPSSHFGIEGVDWTVYSPFCFSYGVEYMEDFPTTVDETSIFWREIIYNTSRSPKPDFSYVALGFQIPILFPGEKAGGENTEAIGYFQPFESFLLTKWTQSGDRLVHLGLEFEFTVSGFIPDPVNEQPTEPDSGQSSEQDGGDTSGQQDNNTV